MSVKDMMKVGGIALATLGLSTCKDNGAVDPAPEPFECPADGAGKDLLADATLKDGLIAVTIRYSGISDASWKAAPTVTDVTGATITNEGFDDGSNYAYRVVLQPDQGVMTGSFHVTGKLEGYANEGLVDCPVDRVFTFTISGGDVTVALRDDLPLGTKARASISIEHHEGQEVHLAATGAVAGATLGWTATAGTVEAAANGRARWRLPREPGLYQIELLVDRGREGLHIDTLTLEVT
jgi:hypothetical protein